MRSRIPFVVVTCEKNELPFDLLTMSENIFKYDKTDGTYTCLKSRYRDFKENIQYANMTVCLDSGWRVK